MRETRGSTRNRLYRHYRREERLYEAILDIAELQHEMLSADGDVDEVLLLAREKERAIRNIEQMERAVEPLKAQWLHNGNRQSAPRDQVNALLENIIQLIHRIMAMERGNEALLGAEKDHMEQSLQRVTHGQRAHRGYHGPLAAPLPRFVDVKV